MRPNQVGDPARGESFGRITGSTRARTKSRRTTPSATPSETASIGPDFFDVDLYLAKRFALDQDLSLEFRIEVFNVANRANFAQPDPFIDSESGGTITGLAGPMREIQWGLRLYF